MRSSAIVDDAARGWLGLQRDLGGDEVHPRRAACEARGTGRRRGGIPAVSRPGSAADCSRAARRRRRRGARAPPSDPRAHGMVVTLPPSAADRAKPHGDPRCGGRDDCRLPPLPAVRRRAPRPCRAKAIRARAADAGGRRPGRERGSDRAPVRRPARASCSTGSSRRSRIRAGPCFIANVVKCRPPQNRKPLPDEREACLPYLRRQIELVRPRCSSRSAAPRPRRCWA